MKDWFDKSWFEPKLQ